MGHSMVYGVSIGILVCEPQPSAMNDTRFLVPWGVSGSLSGAGRVPHTLCAGSCESGLHH